VNSGQEAHFERLNQELQTLRQSIINAWSDEERESFQERVSKRFLLLSAHHAEGVTNLHATNRHEPAVALYRVTFETTARAAWAATMVSETALNNRIEKDSFPKVGDIMAGLRDQQKASTDLQDRERLNFILGIMDAYWAKDGRDLWHDFAHSGQTALLSEYTDDQIEHFRLLSITVAMTVSGTTQFLFDRSTDAWTVADDLSRQWADILKEDRQSDLPHS
jgi:hypothetical protein